MQLSGQTVGHSDGWIYHWRFRPRLVIMAVRNEAARASNFCDEAFLSSTYMI
jgi:hypothetical protein